MNSAEIFKNEIKIIDESLKKGGYTFIEELESEYEDKGMFNKRKFESYKDSIEIPKGEENIYAAFGVEPRKLTNKAFNLFTDEKKGVIIVSIESDQHLSRIKEFLLPENATENDYIAIVKKASDFIARKYSGIIIEPTI